MPFEVFDFSIWQFQLWDHLVKLYQKKYCIQDDQVDEGFRRSKARVRISVLQYDSVRSLASQHP